MLDSYKHSSLLGPFISYQENEVLWIRPLSYKLCYGDDPTVHANIRLGWKGPPGTLRDSTTGAIRALGVAMHSMIFLQKWAFLVVLFRHNKPYHSVIEVSRTKSSLLLKSILQKNKYYNYLQRILKQKVFTKFIQNVKQGWRPRGLLKEGVDCKCLKLRLQNLLD